MLILSRSDKFLDESGFLLGLILEKTEIFQMTAYDNIIELKAEIPTHWVQGQPRTLTLYLGNLTDADLKHPQITIRWDALAAGPCVKTLPSLPPRSFSQMIHIELTPKHLHALMEIHIVTHDGITEYALVSDPIKLAVLPEVQTSQTSYIVRPTIDVKISDKGLMGAAAMGDSSINIGGVQLNVPEADNPQARQQTHITSDPTANIFRSIPLNVRSHSCPDFTNGFCMSLVGISPGHFDMGARADDAEADKSDEMLRRNISIPHAFWMGQFPVTQKQYREVMHRLPEMKIASFVGDDNPVVYVSWLDAIDFCNELTEKEKKAGNLTSGFHYRLPTEAEWEYSCRAGSTEARYLPLHEVGAVAANKAGFGQPGRFLPNDFKLYDMLGLVFEWCADAYAAYSLRQTSHPFRPASESESPRRVTRGGCYQGDDVFARASARASALPETRSGRIGFRVVLAPISSTPVNL